MYNIRLEDFISITVVGMASWEKLYRFDNRAWKYVLKDVVKENQTSPNWIIYVRVSTDKQMTDGNWLESQEKKMSGFCKT